MLVGGRNIFLLWQLSIYTRGFPAATAVWSRTAIIWLKTDGKAQQLLHCWHQKSYFLHRSDQKPDACTQKVGNVSISQAECYLWNSTAAAFVIHCIKACTISHILDSHTKHLWDSKSLLLSLGQEVPSVKKTSVRVQVYVCVCPCLGIFNRTLKMFWDPLPRRQMNTYNKTVEKRGKKKSRQGRNTARITWLRIIVGKAKSQWEKPRMHQPAHIHLWWSFISSVQNSTLTTPLADSRYRTQRPVVTSLAWLMFTPRERSFRWFWVRVHLLWIGETSGYTNDPAELKVGARVWRKPHPLVWVLKLQVIPTGCFKNMDPFSKQCDFKLALSFWNTSKPTSALKNKSMIKRLPHLTLLQILRKWSNKPNESLQQAHKKVIKVSLAMLVT